LSRLAGIILLLACALLAACGSDESSSGESGSASTTATVPAESAQTIANARRAVDGDDYDAAVAVAESLSTGEATSVRRRIANRLASRALAALDRGERGRARRFVIEAKDYPSTARTRLARTTYNAAKAQAAQKRLRAAQQKRLDEAMREAARMRPSAPPAMQRMTPPPAMQRMTPPPAMQRMTPPPAMQRMTPLPPP